jgi:hypothetical protein
LVLQDLQVGQHLSLCGECQTYVHEEYIDADANSGGWFMCPDYEVYYNMKIVISLSM